RQEAVRNQPGVEEVRYLVDALVRRTHERREHAQMSFLRGVAPPRDRLVAQEVEAVAGPHGLTRLTCRAGPEDLGGAAVVVRPEFQVAREARRILTVVPAVADLADDERRPAQGEIDAVTVTVFHRRIAVVAADHRVERLGRLELEPRPPGRER